jgi:hypothetical protein
MEDGATKTALAIQIFGKSGAEMIPLLNGGADGMKRLAEESDRTGNTISTKTAAAAEKFNDTLTRIGEIMQGVVNKVMEAALPALQSLADTLASPDFATAAQTLATNVIGGIDKIIDRLTAAINLLVQFGDKLQWLQTLLPPGLNGVTGISKLAQGASLIRTTNQSGSPDDRGMFGGTPITVHGGTTSTDPFTPSNFTTKAAKVAKVATKDMSESLDRLTEQWQTLTDVTKSFTSTFISDMKQGKTWVDSLADSFGNLGDQLIQMGTNEAIKGLLSALMGGLTNSAAGFSYGAGVFSDPWAGLRGFAGGTMSAPAGLAWVGETGPELMNFRGGESVMPAGQSAAAAGGNTVNFHITGDNPAEIARQVKRILPDALASAQRNSYRR